MKKIIMTSQTQKKHFKNTELCAQHFSQERLYSTKNEGSLQEHLEKLSHPEGLEAHSIWMWKALHQKPV